MSRSGAGKLLAGTVLCIVVLFQVGVCLGGLGRALHGATDFRAFYSAGLMLRKQQGAALYSYAAQNSVEQNAISGNDRMLPFLYPAATAKLFEPLSWLSYRNAIFTFIGVNLVCLAWVCLFLLPRAKRTPSWLLLLLGLCILPCSMVLMQGQISILLLAVYALSHRWEVRRPLLAGLALSLAFVKFQFAIPVLLLLLCWRRWRMCAGALAGCAMLAAVSLWITGVQGQLTYVRHTLGMAHETAMDAAGAKSAYGMFPIDMPNLHGMTFAMLGDGRAAVVVLALLSAAVLWKASSRPAGIPLALTAACLVSYHMQAYDLILLLLPIASALSCMDIDLHTNARTPEAWLIVIAGGLVLAPVGAMVLVWGQLWVLMFAVVAVFLALLLQQRKGLATAPARI